jgi:hypothetical protein
MIDKLLAFELVPAWQQIRGIVELSGDKAIIVTDEAVYQVDPEDGEQAFRVRLLYTLSG